MRPARRRHRVLRQARRGVGAIPSWLIRGYNEANAGDLAAAIAFNALIALVPTTLLLVSLAGMLFRNDEVLRAALLASVWAVPNKNVNEALETVLSAKRNSGIFGLLSLAGFTWVGANFVASLARGMNRIYGVRNRRFMHERMRSLVVIILFSILLATSAFAATLPTLFVKQDVRGYFERWIFNSSHIQLVSYGLALAAALFLFAMLYRIVPNSGQRLLDIWPGAVVAALLFVMLVQVFPLYIRFVGRRNVYGGTFLFATLLVTWFYLMAHAMLFGTYVNATWQHHRRCQGKDGSLLPFRLSTGQIRWLSRGDARKRGLTVGADPCEDPRPHVGDDQVA
ncbi:MAG: YihY/virulence factor BrkB family protein [Thermomicrobiales bacterium]